MILDSSKGMLILAEANKANRDENIEAYLGG